MSLIVKTEPEDEDLALPEIIKQTNRTASASLPQKSKKTYEKMYSQFIDWRKENNVCDFSENVLVAYFNELSKKLKSTSLWTHYSILKSTLALRHKVDLTKYPKLHALLKGKSEGYTPKKAKTFSTNEIKRFIEEAPDSKYLLSKVICIFGIMGACRRHELHKLEFRDVNDFGSMFLVTIKDTKTKTSRIFTVKEKYYEICKKYVKLRPENCANASFFLNYLNEKCTVQNVGINKFGNMGKGIATFLKLPNPSLYTGHCFRRSSATVSIDAGGDLTSIKRESIAEAETSIDGSNQNKINVDNQILNSVIYSQTNNSISIIPATGTSTHHSVTKLPSQLHFNNCTIQNFITYEKE